MRVTCLHPYIREIPQLVNELGLPIQEHFPCGKCPVCRNNDSRDWMLRLSVEADHSINSQFITLTYDEKNIVRIGSVGILVKRDVQLFIKRLRERIADKFPDFPKLRFFLVGEYGGTTHRPHYHAIFFNIPPDCNFRRLVEDCWSKGFVTVSPLNNNRIAYVSGYALLSFLFSPSKNSEIPPPFRVMSRRPGIGAQFKSNRLIEYYRNHPEGITYKGFHYRFPRFYKDAIFIDESDKQKIRDSADRFREEEDRIYYSMYNEIDKYRLQAGLPTMREEFNKRFLDSLQKKYIIHKLHRKL